jgi:hypothetical protein
MKRDLESRRLAIIRALRGRGAVATPPAPERAPEPVQQPARDELGTLKETVGDLASRVDQLSRDLSVLRTTSAPRHHIPETPHVADDDDEPAVRASVPPVSAETVGTHAFDVLLGRP